MIQHLFKMIWNKKKQNFLMILEMFVSFFVMFAVFTLLVYFYSNYAQPIGFTNQTAWVANVNIPEREDKKAEPVSHDAIRNALQSLPEIENVTFTGYNLPFAMSNNNNDIEYQKEKLVSNVYTVDNAYADVLGINVLQGRWFDKTDAALGSMPIIINNKLKERLFKNESPIGKLVKAPGGMAKVIGVVDDVKYSGDYQPAETSFYMKIDTTNEKYHNQMLLKVKPNIPPDFEARLYKLLSGTLKDASIEIEHLENKRTSRNKLTLVPLIITIIIAGFLIINVALGLFGVLWYNINKRKAEIGLRRAIGASGSSISWQLVGEALVLTTLALFVGFFFAIQFPLLNVFDLPATVYIIAIVLTAIFIYLLVMICAFYPGRQAAAIYPARALHED